MTTRMTSAERQVLRNQRVIMAALSLLVPMQERLTRVGLTLRISETQKMLDEAKTWEEGDDG